MTLAPEALPAVPAALPVNGSVRRIAQIPGGADAVGPFSQAVVANGFVFTAGQIPAISGLDDQPDTFEDLVQCVEDICRYWLTRNRTPYPVETPC